MIRCYVYLYDSYIIFPITNGVKDVTPRQSCIRHEFIQLSVSRCYPMVDHHRIAHEATQQREHGHDSIVVPVLSCGFALIRFFIAPVCGDAVYTVRVGNTVCIYAVS